MQPMEIRAKTERITVQRRPRSLNRTEKKRHETGVTWHINCRLTGLKTREMRNRRRQMIDDGPTVTPGKFKYQLAICSDILKPSSLLLASRILTPLSISACLQRPTDN